MRKSYLFLTVILTAILLISSCKKNITDEELKTGTVTDIDGNVYKTVKIGNQWWMAENLKVTHYRTGDTIPNITDGTEWESLTIGAYCNYDNDSNFVNIYDRLYNWYAVNNHRHIAPEGWHVPTDEEWKELEMFLGMSQSEVDDEYYRGTNEGSKLAGNASLWVDGRLENNSVFGESGFFALPAGYRDSDSGNFGYLGYDAYFWSATEHGSSSAWWRGLDYRASGVYRPYNSKENGFSVRLVRD